MHRRYEIRHGGRIQSTVRVASSVLNIRSLGRHTVADNTGEELAAFVAAVEKIIGASASDPAPVAALAKI